MDSSQIKRIIATNIPLINSSLYQLIEIFGCLHKQANVFLHNFANVIWNLKGLEGPHLFCLGYFSSSKNFNHITKDASIFHLKLGGGRRPNYFPTSTPLEHTSHHDG
jgi:hypothetical protein